MAATNESKTKTDNLQTTIEQAITTATNLNQKVSTVNQHTSNNGISSPSSILSLTMTQNKASPNLYSTNFTTNDASNAITTTNNIISDDQLPQPPPIVYGELSILGYNGYIPNTERNGRKNKSKFLLRKRPTANGIKKSRHYIVKQPQATKAIQDKDLHSISYTFSRSQTIIVEYRQDENTDMFQIGRSSEDPIDFVVLDTLATNADSSSSGSRADHQSSRSNHNSENSSNQQQQQQLLGNNDLIGLHRFHRHLAKGTVGEMLQAYGVPPSAHDSRSRMTQYHRHQAAQALLLNYPPNMSNLPPSILLDHYRNHPESSMFHFNQPRYSHNHGHSSGTQQTVHARQMTNGNELVVDDQSDNPQTQQQQQQQQSSSNRHNINMCPKRPHATQSTISRFACRILVDRKPPYTARIYAAGFDSSKNIFLGEKATKWEQNDSIDGLTTNGVLLMHPKRGSFYEENGSTEDLTMKQTSHTENLDCNMNSSGDTTTTTMNNKRKGSRDQSITNNKSSSNRRNLFEGSGGSNKHTSEHYDGEESSGQSGMQLDIAPSTENKNDTNNNNNRNKDSASDQDPAMKETRDCLGGVWREVSVDGGIYEIRESRSAAQKGTMIEEETNILQDGTLIDLCGATLLWRSVEGFKASPTKKSLEEKIDLLNASRPQCPVGLNTLVIPRKPIPPANYQHQHRSGHKEHHHHHHNHHHSSHSNKHDNDKNSHQPYVYLKCGHVQGYHDWGTTDKSNQRTCPICLSVGTVAKLSMGLEPSFYVDSGPLTHVFNPCGHMASEATVRYWCSVKIPHGTHFFHSICPFCATPLAINEPASTRLIFQDDLD